MVLIEILKVSVQNIWSNKMRSILTMLGLIIGIMAVVIITTLGNAAQADIYSAFNEEGKGKININLNYNTERPVQYRDFFTEDDVSAVDSHEDVLAASAEITRWVTLNYGNEETTINLLGVNSNYNEVESIEVSRGRFLTEEDVRGRRNVIIIDERTAMTLFDTLDCIGEKISVTTGYFTAELMVVGVDKLSDSAILNMAMGNYGYGYTPITIASRMYYTDRYPRLMVHVNELVDVDSAGGRILTLLERRNKDSEIYRVSNRESEFKQVNQVINTLTTIISGIAAISLLVGGIGIMNIMLVSVTERTREVGIKKAIGAKRGVILLQFLLEAIILSVLGGLLGLAIGSAIGYGMVSMFKLPFIISSNSITMAFIFSILVGVIFGVYPANKASKMDPINALRYE
ncbi:ABC transporter permease [Alkaliphilus serpentinus]|nr:ABC transporter permease [Alkaliphilus serpentinus]